MYANCNCSSHWTLWKEGEMHCWLRSSLWSFTLRVVFGCNGPFYVSWTFYLFCIALTVCINVYWDALVLQLGCYMEWHTCSTSVCGCNLRPVLVVCISLDQALQELLYEPLNSFCNLNSFYGVLQLSQIFLPRPSLWFFLYLSITLASSLHCVII